MAETIFLIMTFYMERHDSPKKNTWIYDHLAVVTFSLGDMTYL